MNTLEQQPVTRPEMERELKQKQKQNKSHDVKNKTTQHESSACHTGNCDVQRERYFLTGIRFPISLYTISLKRDAQLHENCHWEKTVPLMA